MAAVGAYDHVSRHAMLAALHVCTASIYTWTDGQGVSHHIAQAKGGEQGDALMPAPHSLAQLA